MYTHFIITAMPNNTSELTAIFSGSTEDISDELTNNFRQKAQANPHAILYVCCGHCVLTNEEAEYLTEFTGKVQERLVEAIGECAMIRPTLAKKYAIDENNMADFIHSLSSASATVTLRLVPNEFGEFKWKLRPLRTSKS